jgi:hypothetical protein
MWSQRQHAGEIIAHGRDRFQGHVAGPLHRTAAIGLSEQARQTRPSGRPSSQVKSDLNELMR